MNNQAAAAKVVSAEQSSTTRQGSVIVKLAFDNRPGNRRTVDSYCKDEKYRGKKTVQLDVDKESDQ